MTEDDEMVSETDLIVASIVCFIAVASFYVAYLLGRDLGNLIFN